jgi:hypothetical protein
MRQMVWNSCLRVCGSSLLHRQGLRLGLMGIGVAPVERIIDALRPVIKQYQDLQFWLYQARLLSSPPNSILPKWAPLGAQIYSGIPRAH